MSEHNLMAAFLTGEDGSTSLLATLLTPEHNHPAQGEFRKQFARQLQAAGINIPAHIPPSAVRPQYLSMDLVLVWGDWVIVLENKVQAASITRNQLNRYYRVALKAMLTGEFLNRSELKSKSLAVLYLTPTRHQGSLEFDSLQLDPLRRDKKLHLGWPELLKQMRECFSDSETGEPFARVVVDGCLLVEELLRRNKVPKTPESAERDATRLFLDAVQAKVEAAAGQQGELKLSRWKDPRLDQLYGWQGGSMGNVYLNIFAEGTNLLKEPPVVHAELLFWVIVKNRAKAAHLFSESRLAYWTEQLGLNSTQLEIAEGSRGVVYEEVWIGPNEVTEDKLADLFCRFLTVFGPLMRGSFDITL